MRRSLLFILSSAMLVGGLYLTIFQLLFAHTIFLRFLLGGAVLVAVGLYLLWVDFVAPKLGLKTPES